MIIDDDDDDNQWDNIYGEYNNQWNWRCPKS